jgi:penicillin-binding protein 1A
VANLKHGTVVQGGSTITQQVAKYFLKDDEKTLDRKIKEAIFAMRMESLLDKGRILEIYLNGISLGHNSHGVGSAAYRYFDRPLDELGLPEFAMLAGLARAPTRYDPYAHPDRAQRRREVVLQDMVEAGFISAEERDAAAAQPLELARRADPYKRRAPYYAERARAVASAVLGSEAMETDGLTIETPAHLPWERMADRAVRRAANKLDRKHGWRGPEAHLDRTAQREAFVARATERYGEQPFQDADRWALGLVEQVDAREATIRVGSAVTRLEAKHAVWAGKFRRDTGMNTSPARRVDRVLTTGDVVWVQAVGAKDGPPAEGPVRVRLGQRPVVEGAIFAYDHQTGYVEAMAGGVDFDRSEFNRPVQACRQPGSVFKAIYYALALDGGRHRMDTILEAKPYIPEDGEDWNPRNIGKTLDGRVLLRSAFIKSLNTPSIRLFLELGADRVVDWSRRLGFSTQLIADKGLSLGASCVLTDELTRAFGTYARGGSQRDPIVLRRITDRHGVVRLDGRHPYDGAVDVAGRLDRLAQLAREPAEQLIDPRTAFLINRLMREVVTAGTATRVTRVGVPSAGKSGTASGRVNVGGVLRDMTTDAWFVGFTSRHAVAAWMGFDDASFRSMGDEEASYTTSIPMWSEFMSEFTEGVQHLKIPGEIPPGITKRTVEATHGGPPIEGMPMATLYYLAGTEYAGDLDGADL